MASRSVDVSVVRDWFLQVCPCFESLSVTEREAKNALGRKQFFEARLADGAELIVTAGLNLFPDPGSVIFVFTDRASGREMTLSLSTERAPPGLQMRSRDDDELNRFEDLMMLGLGSRVSCEVYAYQQHAGSGLAWFVILRSWLEGESLPKGVFFILQEKRLGLLLGTLGVENSAEAHLLEALFPDLMELPARSTEEKAYRLLRS